MTTAATATSTIHTTGRTIRRPSDIDNALDWLTHGGELAVALKDNRARHSDVIWQLLVEAVEVIDKSPDRERQWLKSGTRSGWTAPGMSKSELAALERLRMLSGMKPHDSDVTRYSQRGDEERALGVLAWLRWLNSAKSGDRLSKAAIALARSGDLEVVARIYAPARTSRHRQLAYEVKTRTVGFILAGLRDHLGIIPADGVSFHAA
jgi:hypothetical protein